MSHIRYNIFGTYFALDNFQFAVGIRVVEYFIVYYFISISTSAKLCLVSLDPSILHLAASRSFLIVQVMFDASFTINVYIRLNNK